MKNKTNNTFNNIKKEFIILVLVSFFVCLIYKVFFSNSKNEDIINLFIGIIVFKLVLDLAIREKKLKKEINKYEDEHPEQIELIRIRRSKHLGYADKNSKERVKPLIVLIVFGIIFATIMLTIDSIYYSTLANVGMAFFATFCLSLIIIKIIKQKNLNKYIYTLIANKYGVAQLLPTPSKKETGGNMRNNYTFSCKILKYRCILTSYYRELFSKSYSSVTNSFSYRWRKLHYIFNYSYNLEALGMKNISVQCLENEKIKNIIDKLSKTKSFKAYIEDKYLVVEKDTVIAGYKKEDAVRDVEDIELFYHKIVKTILDNK